MSPNRSRAYVEITAYWGNDDASSTIRLSPSRWAAIEQGAEYEKSAWSWYEGVRSSVTWRFAQGEVTIEGEDAQCVVDLPVGDLLAEVVTPP